ncbi:hypothetical protein [Singulisphaera sp. PoT]|uniref:hypothetical protein n=1 Tax=Singulisphaera sp. PoT TaxID=3411797 RepID=UPI003BF586F6
MHLRRLKIDRRRADHYTLVGLRITLALTFLILGWVLLSLPSFIDGPSQLGLSRGGRSFLGSLHIAVGAALLAPSLAAGAAAWLGVLVVWATVPWLPGGLRTVPLGPCLLTLALIALIVSLRIRRQRSFAAWQAMLSRYAEGQGKGRSE